MGQDLPIVFQIGIFSIQNALWGDGEFLYQTLLSDLHKVVCALNISSDGVPVSLGNRVINLSRECDIIKCNTQIPAEIKIQD